MKTLTPEAATVFIFLYITIFIRSYLHTDLCYNIFLAILDHKSVIAALHISFLHSLYLAYCWQPS